ncbi:MAG: PIG-L deacetylase family protein [Balneolaceae bacterium]|nr:PIG-L deacetylase family protein [Balneolaceae bacterium]
MDKLKLKANFNKKRINVMTILKKICTIALVFGFITSIAFAQPETPVSQWSDKTILLVGAHPDDDSRSYGTLSMLQENGNEVYVLLLTTGNVGTKDPDMSRFRLAEIRNGEEIRALNEIGIPEENYINLGYNDGMLEFADREEVVRRLVKWYREIKPDVLFAFDPGYGYQKWFKSDHRTASYLAVDAARAAEWRLIFPGQITQDGLEAHLIEEYMFYRGVEKDKNTWVDISGEHADRKFNAVSMHVSQFSSAWDDYNGMDLEAKDLEPEARDAFLENMRNRVYENTKDGNVVEGFRYYKGVPDGIGHRD